MQVYQPRYIHPSKAFLLQEGSSIIRIGDIEFIVYYIERIRIKYLECL